MSKVLYIKANAKPEGESRTFRISDSFIAEYKKQNPEDEITTIDLYKEGIGFLSAKGISLKFNPGDRTDPLLKYANQFTEADKYVFAEPLWNLGIPAILKAYIDYICIVGLTFKYTENGAVGLLKGKKAVNITTRGGMYSQGPFAEREMGDKYLKNIMSFLGVEDYTTISAETLDVVGSDVEKLVGDAIRMAERFAETF